MGSLQTRIERDFVQAMKSGDEVAKSVLRMLRAEITRKEIDLQKKGSGLEDAEIGALVVKEIKKRQEAIDAYKKGERHDLVAQEEKEMNVLEGYRPAQLHDEDLKNVIQRVIIETQDGERDLGKIMKRVMEEVRGQAEGARARLFVEEMLQSNSRHE